MRPAKFGKKPSRNDPNRFRRTSRIGQFVGEFMPALSKIPGGKRKVEAIASLVLCKIHFEEPKFTGGNAIEQKMRFNEKEKQRLFKRSAEAAMKKRMPIGSLHCAERSNLAVALLNAAGIKSWLVRYVFDVKEKDGSLRGHFHDYVEFYLNGKVNTLMFRVSSLGTDGYEIFDGPLQKNAKTKNLTLFRGADSKQIGGAGNMEEFERFWRKLSKNPAAELEKNKKRIALLAKNEIIPKNALKEIL